MQSWKIGRKKKSLISWFRKNLRLTFFILIKTSMVVIRLLYILDSFVWFLERFDLLNLLCMLRSDIRCLLTTPSDPRPPDQWPKIPLDPRSTTQPPKLDQQEPTRGRESEKEDKEWEGEFEKERWERTRVRVWGERIKNI